ncbi:IMPACT family protein [Curtobacterium herbarum]|uniref:YigZ family protein n=1 Tax=Curtobacterium herbarum TaxID=150122 RepID=A0ABP4KBU4_9MICO|nr:YigZ family protein [Curtobacterium herbarum]MBM7475043.1 putative YigZ family protein [Curtobacterium herbarum]MCS6545686.1 IMPACT family protein [Curtobacterium herbarum]
MSRRYPSTIAGPVEHEFVVSRSRFVTTAHPAPDPAAAEAVVAEVRRRSWDARHHCTAMVTGVLGDQARSSDDGEPSGTAGVPMLEVLRRRDLTDVVVVVSRWFGGVKLGAGGLVRAYSTSVSGALDQATVIRRAARTRVQVAVPHADAGRVDNALRAWVARHDATADDTVYGEQAVFTLWVPLDGVATLEAELASVSAGALVPVLGEERVVDLAPS